MAVDYSVFRKRLYLPSQISDMEFDVFVSALNQSERVRDVWDGVTSIRRVGIVHHEYGFEGHSVPNADLLITNPEVDELSFWFQVFETVAPDGDFSGLRVAVDITGLMRHYVVALPLAAAIRGIVCLSIVYSDPSAYVQGDRTEFSRGKVIMIRPVSGFEGSHQSGLGSSDVLVIGGGYDHVLISAVAENKRAAEHVVVVGMPSLQPHMYQENLLRLSLAKESIRGYSRLQHLLAPASDPFATAGVLASFAEERFGSGGSEVNLYLSPLGPKTQVLGFAWFYLCDRFRESVSIILPTSGGYSAETSTGLGRTWVFDLELKCVDVSEYLD
ncbi:hypothetical protein [Gordonia sp. NPDC003422]